MPNPLNCVASYFPRCYQDDQNINECFINAANSLNQYVRSGIPEIGLRLLDPFVSPEFNVTVESPITDFYASLKGFALHRLYNYRFKSADVRPQDGAIAGNVIFPDLAITSDYAVQGHVINLQFNGRGYVDVENENAVCDFIISDWPKARNCNEIKLKVDCKVEDLKVNITGLENGEAMNSLLNLSSKLVASEISPGYSSVFEVLLKVFLRRLCRKYQFKDLFPPSS
ncbi:uncharacterized protein LOC116161459 [Photinus pyralis]|uniref:uncharacterized protein LOC116161459 n=1 Tax=Photinus pyralis TaxID=7054 RepID=UPI001267817F|nr:uncharacterized protein LOC116161459 [Photinus pyralis]